MRIFGLLSALCLLSLPAFADEAPFGLRWGESAEELKSHEISGEIRQGAGHLRLIETNRLPNGPKDTNFANLGIDQKFGLQRIQWVSKDISDDITGEKGLAQYRTLKRSLSERYGAPKSSEEEMIGNRADSFYQCLAEDGCGAFVTVWRTPETDVRLRLLGTTSGKGRLEVVYLGPDWSDIEAEIGKKPKH
jgi:hypothetical protein